jgi:dolichol-phosphate mannosyltransferase
MTRQASNAPGPTFSLVAPLCDAGADLAALHGRLVAAGQRLGGDLEVVYVDNGSADGTAASARAMCVADGRVRLLELSRRFGWSAAMAAGCDRAAGRAAVVVDPTDPRHLEAMAALAGEWRAGAELVLTSAGAGGRRSAAAALDRLIAWWARYVGGRPRGDDEEGACLLDRAVLQGWGAARREGRGAAALSDAGFRQAAVSLPTAASGRPRRAPGSGEAAGGLLAARLSAAVGAAAVVAALLCSAAVILLAPLAGLGTAAGWLGRAALGMLGLQLLAVGALGEHVYWRLADDRSKWDYVIRSACGFNRAAPAERAPRAAEPADEDRVGITIYT